MNIAPTAIRHNGHTNGVAARLLEPKINIEKHRGDKVAAKLFESDPDHCAQLTKICAFMGVASASWMLISLAAGGRHSRPSKVHAVYEHPHFVLQIGKYKGHLTHAVAYDGKILDQRGMWDLWENARQHDEEPKEPDFDAAPIMAEIRTNLSPNHLTISRHQIVKIIQRHTELPPPTVLSRLVIFEGLVELDKEIFGVEDGAIVKPLEFDPSEPAKLTVSTSLLDQIREVQTKKPELERLRKQHAQLAEKLRAADRERQDAEAALSAAESRCAAARGASKNLQAEKDDIDARLASMADIADTLELLKGLVK